MEPKKSKVEVAAYTREFSTPNGQFFCHQVTFENKDSGEYVSKSQDQTKFVIGQEAEYTIDASNTAFPPKIKPYSTFQAASGGGSFAKKAESPDRQKSIERQKALELALQSIDINAHGLDAVFTVAEKLATWLGKRDAESAAPVASTITEAEMGINKQVSAPMPTSEALPF